jgi:hypothetical protein
MHWVEGGSVLLEEEGLLLWVEEDFQPLAMEDSHLWVEEGSILLVRVDLVLKKVMEELCCSTVEVWDLQIFVETNCFRFAID